MRACFWARLMPIFLRLMGLPLVGVRTGLADLVGILSSTVSGVPGVSPTAIISDLRFLPRPAGAMVFAVVASGVSERLQLLTNWEFGHSLRSLPKWW